MADTEKIKLADETIELLPPDPELFKNLYVVIAQNDLILRMNSKIIDYILIGLSIVGTVKSKAKEGQ